MMTRGSGWGTMHSAPPYRADDPPGAPKISEEPKSGSMLRKSRLGKGTPSLVCQECQAEGAVQLKCFHVLCRPCAKEHIHA